MWGSEDNFVDSILSFRLLCLHGKCLLPTEPSHQPAFEVLTKLYTSLSLEKVKEVFKRHSAVKERQWYR